MSNSNEGANPTGTPSSASTSPSSGGAGGAGGSDRAADARAALGFDPERMQDTLRQMTERSVEQSREAYSRMKTAADEATRTLETTLENAHGGSLSLSKKAIESMRAHAELGFSHLEQLSKVRSLAEMIELQTSFYRQQVEVAGEQAREMQSLSQRIAQELVRPSRDAMERATPGKR